MLRFPASMTVVSLIVIKYIGILVYTVICKFGRYCSNITHDSYCNSNNN